MDRVTDRILYDLYVIHSQGKKEREITVFYLS